MERLFFCMIPQTISGLFKNEYKQIIMKTENISMVFSLHFIIKNFDYPEKPLKYKHIRRISD